MQISKTQRFGLIVFIILIIAAILVTTEPWKKSSGEMQTSLEPGASPPEILLAWTSLSTGYPLTLYTDTILSYSGFDLGYNEKFEQAAWVAYVLTREEIESGHVERTDNFRTDPNIATGSASLADYRRSGFDRGHLAPAGDMQWDSLAMSESFLMSNMSPQTAQFNRGIWRMLETEVRNWALEKDSIYVITGPVLPSVDSLIGENEVGVPRYYFKVLVDLSPPDHSMIAFLLPNLASSDSLMHFAVTVDSLETVTGYDFFAGAPDQEAMDWLEKQLDPDSWK
jgi:endonuclease G